MRIAHEAACRRLTDRALSCRPPVTLPWSTDGRPRVSPTDAGGRRLADPETRADRRRPVSSHALLGSALPEMEALGVVEGMAKPLAGTEASVTGHANQACA